MSGGLQMQADRVQGQAPSVPGVQQRPHSSQHGARLSYPAYCQSLVQETRPRLSHHAVLRISAVIRKVQDLQADLQGRQRAPVSHPLRRLQCRSTTMLPECSSHDGVIQLPHSHTTLARSSHRLRCRNTGHHPSSAPAPRTRLTQDLRLPGACPDASGRPWL
jgi:hypothetical protein